MACADAAWRYSSIQRNAAAHTRGDRVIEYQVECDLCLPSRRGVQFRADCVFLPNERDWAVANASHYAVPSIIAHAHQHRDQAHGWIDDLSKFQWYVIHLYKSDRYHIIERHMARECQDVSRQYDLCAHHQWRLAHSHHRPHSPGAAGRDNSRISRLWGDIIIDIEPQRMAQ